MSFGTGFAEGMENTIGGGSGAKKGENNPGKNNGLTSEIRKGVAKLSTLGKSGRGQKSSSDTASEYSGVNPAGFPAGGNANY